MAISKSVLFGGLGLAIVLGVGGTWAVTHNRGDEIPKDQIATVTRGDLEILVSETGRIQPLTKVDVKSKVAGQVHSLLVKEGDHVQAGQVLLELDPTDFKRQLAQAAADRDMAKAQLDGLLVGSRPEDVAAARADLDQALARAKQASEDKNRASRALAAGSLTPREWDAALAESRESEAGVGSARSKLARLQAGATAQEIAEARARLAKAAVALASAKDQLAYSVIRAPIAGTVIHRGIEIGEMVTPGVSETGDRKPLLTVADLSKLVVESDINQVDVGKLSLGQPVTIRVDTLPGDTFQGHIYKVAPAAVAGKDPEIQLFPTQTMVDGAGIEKLRPGMSADLDVFVQKRASVLQLPVEAIVHDRGLKGHVTRLHKGKDGRWVKEKRDVLIGASSDHETEIVKGLDEGDQVLIDPASAKDNVNQF